MRRRERRMARIIAVRREFQTALVALDLLADLLRRNPGALAGHDLRQADHRNLRSNLQSTYTVRLFAEFESGLRDFWARAIRDTHPKTAELLDSIGSRRS